MLKSKDPNLRIASLQCLSQLVLDSKSCKGKTQQNLGRATEILINEQAVWPEFLYHYLVESGSDHSIQRVGLSCLMRLVKAGSRIFSMFGASMK